MKYLIDTALFLWMFFGEEKKVSPKAMEILTGKDPLYLSSVSTWEITIKYGLGKLELDQAPEKCIPEAILQMGLRSLPILQKHTLWIASLPLIHKDPFDRMLVAQTKIEDLILLSPDCIFKKYKINVIW